mmetsp:Transcript_68875/g.193204  ORF Transcript_68875/g.193204 Transcript_68875/m.193204 type:complete len:209 (+) Transcript_68875:2-628(+)
MVIPMGAPGVQLPDTPPQDAAPVVAKLRRSALALIGFGLLRVILAIAFGFFGLEVLSFLLIFLSASMGIFILKHDPMLAKAYNCLSTTLFRACAERGMDGLQCLTPFIVLNAIDFVLDLIQRWRMLGVTIYGWAMLGSIVAEGLCAYYGWCLLKACDNAAGGGTTEMSGRSSGARAASEGGGSVVGGARASGGSNFVVFSGTGNRLGG